MQEEKISLYCTNASSDKEYHLQLVAQGAGFSLNYQNGRRGSTLTSGTKTPVPVAYAVAKKAYDKKVKEQLGKGYSPGEAGTAFVGSGLEARFTGILPQLLTPVGPELNETLLRDPDWFLQQKEDGRRRMLKVNGTDVVGVNRKGLVTGLPQSVIDAVKVLASDASFGDAVLDGELVGEVFALFDVLEIGGKDIRGLSVEQRLVFVDKLKAQLEAAGTPGMFGIFTARGEEAKRKHFAALVESKAEGVVYKRRDAAYEPGRPSKGGNQVKRKFTKDATFIVEKLHATKRSIHLALLDEAGMMVSVGKCTIPPNYDIPSVGDLVDVVYLYAFPGGSIFQPVYKGKRDDLDREACALTQLHYKAGTDDDDETEES